jgi:hypothetical protein
MAAIVDAIIQVKRGPESERINIPFRDGELAYSTDAKRLYIGDGSTPGGNAASSKLYYGDPSTDLGSSIQGMVVGDYFLDNVNGAYTPILYAYTGNDYTDFPNSYTLLCDNNPAISIFTLVQDNSAFWGTNGGVTFADAQTCLADNSAKWESAYNTVYANSANWDLLVGPGGGTGGGTTNVFVVNSIVVGNSAKWDESSTVVQDNSANWLVQEGIKEEAYFSPGTIVTSNQFLQINIGGTIRYIRLWDVAP